MATGGGFSPSNAKSSRVIPSVDHGGQLGESWDFNDHLIWNKPGRFSTVFCFFDGGTRAVHSVGPEMSMTSRTSWNPLMAFGR